MIFMFGAWDVDVSGLPGMVQSIGGKWGAYAVGFSAGASLSRLENGRLLEFIRLASCTKAMRKQPNPDS